jgi:hypothetical protein
MLNIYNIAPVPDDQHIPQSHDDNKQNNTTMSDFGRPLLPDPPGQPGLSEAEKEIAWEEHSYMRAKKRDEGVEAETKARECVKKNEKQKEKAHNRSWCFEFWIRWNRLGG